MHAAREAEEQPAVQIAHQVLVGAALEMCGAQVAEAYPGLVSKVQRWGLGWGWGWGSGWGYG